KHGFDADALHGDMEQRDRLKVLDRFRKQELKLLVASDVAARGLDIPAVSHVFNFDVPSHAEDYVHRIGRTGRAGRSGTAMTLATSLDNKYVIAIEKLTGEKAEKITVGGVVPTADNDSSEAPRERGRRGDRRRGGDKPAGEARAPRPERSEERAEARPEQGEAKPAHADRPQGAARGDRSERQNRDRRREGDDRHSHGGEPRREADQPRGPRQDNRPPRQDQPRDQGRNDQRPRRDDRRRDRDPDDRPVVGMGDHVPQFMLRPTRLPSSS
ncbi:MAG: helicase-related protein, partial [Bauldia sp.]